MVKKTKHENVFYKDAPFTKLQEKMCSLAAAPPPPPHAPFLPPPPHPLPCLTTKHYGFKQELEKTISFISLIVWPANAKKKKVVD